ncbi:phage tail tape measure protein [Bordetella genomosp. 4]|uniref:Phage tail tape measure protein n=1 Tax=Bordetella genomosp. 4 TaxID=463044 RepID=A0A261UU99_9BORD|nr:phage tail tape measure protein [Bordetella genomosp. 4]OZI64922.1 phage tail tape measure protein [Bordetella genomosp. 4]
MSNSRSLGTLTLDLIAKLGGFESGMDRAGRISKAKSDQIGKDAESAAARTKAAYATIAAVAAGTIAGISLGTIFGSVIQETKQAEREQAQLAAVLKSTGEAAGFSRDQLNAMAAELEGKSIFSAGDINQAQTAFLAFNNIVGNEFVRAQQAAADMATRTGMSIQSAAETIGRALDIPSEGMASLTRQGFKFGEQERELVAALESVGKVGEAQAIVLQALESSYGGAAEAARNTFGGALDGLRNTISGLLTADDGSLEGARLAVEDFNKQLSSPEAVAAFSALVTTIAEGAGLLVRALTSVPWEKTLTVAGAIAVVLGARLAAAATASAVSFAAATAESVRYQMALASMAGLTTRAAAGITAMGVAARVASGAMALLGGPVGAAITAGAALVYFATSAGESKSKAEDLGQQVDYLSASFDGFTKSNAQAALIDIRNQLAQAQLKSLDASDAVNTLSAKLAGIPNTDPRFQSLNDQLIKARSEFDNASGAASRLNDRIVELSAIIAGFDASAAGGAVTASKTFTELSDKINEQILLTGKRTEADKLAARIGAGLVKGLKEGEGEKLIALQRTADQKAEEDKKEREREAKAKAAAQSAQSAAASAAKAREQRAAEAIKDYERQIELINTTGNRQQDASEASKLAFELESGKLTGISEQQKARLKQLAQELDIKLQLKRENENAIKLASYAATLDERNQTASDGFELELAGAGMGDKYKERLREILTIRQEFNREMSDLQAQLNKGDIDQGLYDAETEILRKALEDRLALQRDFYEQQDEAQANWLDGVSSAWENYRDTAVNYQQQAADFISGTLDDTTVAIGNNLAAMALESENLGDAVVNVAATMARSIINALAQMAAQWLVYQAVQLVAGKTAQASAATTLAANATATSLQAGLAAFASTAAIPIVGPFLAPAAMATALAATAPVAAAVSAAAFTGMAHDGIDAVPETGTWLLKKGERVTTAETSAKLDSVLSRIDSNVDRSGRGLTVVLNEDRERAGTVDQSTGLDGEDVIRIFVANIRNGGDAADAIQSSYGLRRVGR